MLSWLCVYKHGDPSRFTPLLYFLNDTAPPPPPPPLARATDTLNQTVRLSVRGYNIMATCDCSAFVGGPCGCSNSNPANVTCVPIAQCGKDIKSHLKFFACFDSTLKTEADLLLARAGKSQ